jgi:hypothetical protein
VAEAEAAGQDSVGSLAEETARLLNALAAGARRSSTEDGTAHIEGHVCTTGWCPICQVVGYVHENPEVVVQVTDAAMEFGRTVRDVLERTLPSTPPPTDEA